MCNIPDIRSIVQPRFLVVYLLCLSFVVAAMFAISSQRAFSQDGQMASQADTVPYLGLTYVRLSHDLASRYNLEGDTGLLVTEVSQGSPAALAGLSAGDILLTADSVPLTRASSLVAQMMDRKPGEVLSVELLRDGELLALEVAVGVQRP